KDLFSGISRVKSYLKNIDGQVRIKIFSNCTNLIRELKNYWWGDNDIPVKKDDHCLDELRYYIMTKPNCSATFQTKTPIEKHKDKLIRKINQNRRKIV
ncbi:MAG: hypothetical protein J5779_00325, partial [Clostridia bacterium]|nr:hypothetical protein [Clostridia bacterium]